MNCIVVGQATQTKVEKADQAIELRDESGRLLGYFAPTPSKSVYDQFGPGISEEELDRRSRKGGGRTLSEILAGLERQK